MPRIRQGIMSIARRVWKRWFTGRNPVLLQFVGPPWHAFWQFHHAAPQLGESDMVVRADPCPQFWSLLAGGCEKVRELFSNGAPIHPQWGGNRWQLVEHVGADPAASFRGIKFGGHRVEFAAVFGYNTDGNQVDGGAIFDEFGVVEVFHGLYSIVRGFLDAQRVSATWPVGRWQGHAISLCLLHVGGVLVDVVLPGQLLQFQHQTVSQCAGSFSGVADS